MSKERELESLGVFVHGVLFMGHTLGAVYNYKRAMDRKRPLVKRMKNWLYLCFHLVALGFDGLAVFDHLRDLQPKRR